MCVCVRARAHVLLVKERDLIYVPRPQHREQPVLVYRHMKPPQGTRALVVILHHRLHQTLLSQGLGVHSSQ